jgi:hypothetical protein
MSKAPSPLLGYNNNVRHKNRVFHIQTEDSGIKHPHIITHLFMDGGRILKSIKRSYAEHVGSENMSDTVRAMMKEQHKSMLIALRDGQFDHILDGEPPKAEPSKPGAAKADAPKAEAPKPEAPKPEPAKPEASPAPAAASSDPQAAAAAARPAESPAAAAKPATKPEPSIKVPKTEPMLESPAYQRRVTQGMIPASPPAAQARPQAAPASTRGPVPSPKRGTLPPSEEAPMTTRQDAPPSGVVVDVQAVERAALEGQPLFQANDLPPPPKNLFNKEKTTGAYRSLSPLPDPEPEPRAQKRPVTPASRPSSPPRSSRGNDLPPPPPRPPSRPAPGGVQAKPPPASRPPGPLPARHPAPAAAAQPAAAARSSGGSADGRYAPARPAAIFGQARPHQGSIFGEDLISDKSLDEVILSYLAEDLEPPPKKR